MFILYDTAIEILKSADSVKPKAIYIGVFYAACTNDNFTQFHCLKKLTPTPNKIMNDRCKTPIILKMRIISIIIDTPMQIIYDIRNVSLISENKNKHGGLPQKGKGGSQV